MFNSKSPTDHMLSTYLKSGLIPFSFVF